MKIYWKGIRINVRRPIKRLLWSSVRDDASLDPDCGRWSKLYRFWKPLGDRNTRTFCLDLRKGDGSKVSGWSSCQDSGTVY